MQQVWAGFCDKTSLPVTGAPTAAMETIFVASLPAACINWDNAANMSSLAMHLFC